MPSLVRTLRERGAQAVQSARVSVVIPTYNCAAYLPACLTSLLKQTVPAELIVVDDGSTDDTASALQGLPGHVRVLRIERNRGAPAARTIGQQLATTEFVCHVDADAIYYPDFLRSLVGALLADPKAAFAYAGCVAICPKGTRKEYPAKVWDAGELWWGNDIPMPAVVRRDWLPEKLTGHGAGGWFEDWDLWLQIARRGGYGVAVPKVLYEVQQRDEGRTYASTTDRDVYWATVCKVRRAYLDLAGGLQDMPVSIVLAARGLPGMTIKAIHSATRYTGLVPEIVYVDDGSSMQGWTVARVRSALMDSGCPHRIVRLGHNQGWLTATNRGIRETAHDGREKVIVLLNNDVKCGASWLEILLWHLRQRPEIGIVGPLTDDGLEQSWQKPGLLPDSMMRGVFDDFIDTPLHASDYLWRYCNRKFVERKTVYGFAMAIRPDCLYRVGFFDPAFNASHGRACEDDLCHRAQRWGYRVGVALSSFVSHRQGVSFRHFGLPPDEDMVRIGHGILKEKWGAAFS